MMNNEYDQAYYSRQYRKSLVSTRGNKPFFYAYWHRCLKSRGLLSANTNLLDYGCGEGFWLKKVRNDTHAFGLDISPYAVEITRKRAPGASVAVIDGDIIPYSADFFDVITAFDVIEHLIEPEKLIREFHRILKPEGTAVISTPNLDSWGKKIKRESWHGARDSSHISMRNRNAWAAAFRLAGFEIERIGTDLLWDTPYVKFIPGIVQRLIFSGSHNLLFRIAGFTRFKHGENLYLIVRKKRHAHRN